MCRVNDAIRQEYQTQIENLQNEWNNEDAKLKDLEESKEELGMLVSEAQCAIDNLSNCDFGGTKVLDSVKTSQQGYQDRIDYYDKYIMECKNAMETIEIEKNAAIAAKNALPVNCGYCEECLPPPVDMPSDGETSDDMQS